MTNEELVVQIQAGGIDLLPELWAQVERFIAQQAGKRVRAMDGYGGIEAEDLYQAGYFAVVEAVKRYNPAAGASFIHFLTFLLRREFDRAMGRHTSKRNPLDKADSLDRPIGEDDATLADVVPDHTDPYEDTELAIWREQLRAALDKALEHIPPEQADIVRRRNWRGETLPTIAADLGVSPERVRQKEYQALQNLRNYKARRRLKGFIEERTHYYQRGSVERFRSTGMSVVEEQVLWRERLLQRMEEARK